MTSAFQWYAWFCSTTSRKSSNQFDPKSSFQFLKKKQCAEICLWNWEKFFDPFQKCIIPSNFPYLLLLKKWIWYEVWPTKSNQWGLSGLIQTQQSTLTPKTTKSIYLFLTNYESQHFLFVIASQFLNVKNAFFLHSFLKSTTVMVDD